jgi:hypothetical protein
MFHQSAVVFGSVSLVTELDVLLCTVATSSSTCLLQIMLHTAVEVEGIFFWSYYCQFHLNNWVFIDNLARSFHPAS